MQGIYVLQACCGCEIFGYQRRKCDEEDAGREFKQMCY